jgi:hypothetical protein
MGAKGSSHRATPRIQRRSFAVLPIDLLPSAQWSTLTTTTAIDNKPFHREVFRVVTSFTMESPWMLASKLRAVRPRQAQAQLQSQLLRKHVFFQSSSLSTNTNRPKKDETDAAAATAAVEGVHAQPFVQTRIKAGEWDPARTDPLYRPVYKSRSKIISADDFNARPTVGLEESSEFDSFQDAMVTLSWLDQGDHQQIYQIYCDLISRSQEKHGTTSHEYVMRVIAQKYNITPGRVAAVVQLQHNEEQIKRQYPDRVLLTKTAEYMDAAIKKEINDAYQTFGLKKPDDFVEDPVGSQAPLERSQWQVVEDVFDVDQIMEDTVVREEREARLAIDGHKYIEDVDDSNIQIPLSKDARQLLKAKARMNKNNAVGNNSSGKDTDKTDKADTDKEPFDWPVNQVKPRPRWKFVAQTVNTRQLKKERAVSRGYTNNSPVNTLVEHDGTLTAATLQDVKLASWKPVRHVQEHTYSSAKQGWLDRSVRGDETAWGMAPVVRERPVAEVETEAETKIEAETNAEAAKSSTESGESQEKDAKKEKPVEGGVDEEKAAADSSDDSSSSSDDDDENVDESPSSSDEDTDTDDDVKKDKDPSDKTK